MIVTNFRGYFDKGTLEWASTYIEHVYMNAIMSLVIPSISCHFYHFEVTLRLAHYHVTARGGKN